MGFDWDMPDNHASAPLNFTNVPDAFKDLIRHMCSIDMNRRPSALQVYNHLRNIVKRLEEERAKHPNLEQKVDFDRLESVDVVEGKTPMLNDTYAYTSYDDAGDAIPEAQYACEIDTDTRNAADDYGTSEDVKASIDNGQRAATRNADDGDAEYSGL